MKRQNVQDAYRRIRPSGAERERMLRNILSAASETPPGRKDTTMKYRNKKPVLIAAIIALMVLLMGCAVALLTLQDLKIGESTSTQSQYDEKGDPIGETEVVMDVISLQGVEGTPNFLAAKEWYEFERSYDPDQELIDSSFPVPSAYEAYPVYNQEMADKVAELCAKYGLKPLGKTAHMQRYQFDALYQALGMDSLFRAGVRMENGVGYFTEYGNFNVLVSITLTSTEAQWKAPLEAAIRYVGKDYFDTMNAVVEHADSAEQWNYPLADGTKVLLVRNETSALILCDRDDAFLSVFLEAYDEAGQTEPLAKRDIELAAEGLNLTVKPRQPDMSQVDRLLAEAEQAYQEALTADDPESYEEMLDTRYYEPFFRDWDLSGGLYYALADLNGDGTEELLLGTEPDSFGAVCVMAKGKVMIELMNQTGSGIYLCENGVIEAVKTESNGSFLHSYRKLEKEVQMDGFTDVGYVRYDAAKESWCSRPHYEGIEDAFISEEEAKAILDSHPRVELEMKPISEFSAD